MPGQSQTLVPLYRILVNGADLDPLEADAVHLIKVTDFLRLPDICTLELGYDELDRLDESKFQVGAPLEVKLGGTTDNVTKPLFKGEIVTVEPNFAAGGVSMVVRAYDHSHRMMRSRKQRTFKDVTFSDIVRQVCQENGLSADVQSTDARLDVVVQHSETDWDFIWRLAGRVGFELIVEDRKATFTKPKTAAGAVELKYPDDLHSFRPRITAVQQVKTVNVRGWDSASKRTVVGTTSYPEQVTEAGITRAEVRDKFAGGIIEIGGQSFSSQAEATEIAKATLNQLANAYLAAEGECEGNPLIKAGTTLKIRGVGTKFSGIYRVAKAVHMLSAGGYVTQFSNSAGEHTLLGQAGGANGSVRRIDSIVIGVVTNNRDPENRGRVRVKLPSLSEVETFWAPVVVPSAGNERGLMMLPVPNEQVIVAFENGDPSYPVVLGSMFNGRDKTYTADTKKGDRLAEDDGSFALKSDHKALIAAMEDITLRSQRGKLDIEINGGDVIETVKKGYTGEFGAAWNLKGQTVTVEANSAVTIKAPSITVDASASLTLKGAAIDIKGSATVNITGAMINIG